MLLTCPKCRSGLEVPDGTTAMVRCPACKTVFAPLDRPPRDNEEAEEEPKAKKRKLKREEENEKPQKKKKEDSTEEDEENRDFDPITEEEDRRSRKKRRRVAEEDLTPEERASRRAAFNRATWGCKLIWLSFGFFIISMMVILVFFFQLTFHIVTPSYLIIAGVLGLINWILAAIGVGLCLTGPRAVGHWGYGIAAAVAICVHAIFLLAVISQNSEFVFGQVGTDMNLETVDRWGRLPTRIDATMYYLTFVFYHSEEGFTPKGKFLLSMITGLAEMIRTVLILMFLSCLAKAALDEDLAHKCTRAAGVVSFGPGIVALLMLATVASLVETNAGVNLFTMILILVVLMSVYAILIAVMMPAFLAAREVTDACEEPFQSLIPQL